MSHYVPPIRDLQFNLFEFLDLPARLEQPGFGDLDDKTASDMLTEMAKLSATKLAASFESSDREPPTFDPATHQVTLPSAFSDSYQAYLDGEWWRMDLPAELEGLPVPPSLRWALAELVLGANPAIHLYASGHAFASIVHELGTPDQRRLAALMAARHWGSTMVLTEPDAGSDVGAGRAKAIQQPDGSWHVQGVKRFITSAEADIYENVVHLVLARPVGHGPGTKGLSLFVVPKFQVDLETGELGERNGAYVTNVEHKLGLKVSATCEVRFGEVDGQPAVGTLLGDSHDGIAQMFRIIESARMMVGTKAVATLSAGYATALAFARTRVQGADLTRQTDKSAPRVTITHHPDVRRSLLLQKSYAEGLRAMLLYTASQQDAVASAQAGGGTDESAAGLSDLLLPLVKGAGSERAWVLLGTESLQTLGGSGFLEDYPIAQYVRDSKIDTLYEGTTAIQGLDFFFRKIVRDRGRSWGELVSRIAATCGPRAEDDPFKAERQALELALEQVQLMVGQLTQWAQESADDPQRIYLVGQNTSRLLLAAGDLVVGWLLLAQAEVAQTALGSGQPSTADRAFYLGKVAAARFFAGQVLPLIGAQLKILQGSDQDLMLLPEEAF